jgi:serine/threonine-protein kinase
MGIVHHADDLRLGHAAALKFLPPELAADPRRLAQFHSEVSLARQISHPNVCRVYDIGDVDGHLFLSMEFIDGEDLSSALRRRGPIPEAEAVELIRQICAGLSAVHARGILHRDLKPANIMLGAAGQVHLMDFGIAGAAEAQHAIEGTPAYMAPEQLLGKELTTQSDIYALGLIIHEMLTGKSMFGAHTLEQLVARHSATAVAAPDVPAAIAPTLRKAMLACLERDPASRPFPRRRSRQCSRPFCSMRRQCRGG